MIENEDKNNVGQSSASDRKRDRGTRLGGIGGTRTSADVGGIDRSGGGIDGGTASAAGGISGGASVEPDRINAANGDATPDRDTRNVDRGTRRERERGNRTIRLDFGNRDTDAGTTDASAGTGETQRDRRDDSKPVIRLGARTQGEPRSAKARTETTSKASKLSEVRELIKVFVNSVFDIPATMLKQDFWRLSKDESRQLTDALVAWFESMPNSDQSKIAEFMGKHLPVINLAMIAFFIVGERVKMSLAIYQVTKHGKRFAESVKTTAPDQPDARTVKTALDNMFSN